MKELASQKEIPHRDFYNVRKVIYIIFKVSELIIKHVC